MTSDRYRPRRSAREYGPLDTVGVAALLTAGLGVGLLGWKGIEPVGWGVVFVAFVLAVIAVWGGRITGVFALVVIVSGILGGLVLGNMLGGRGEGSASTPTPTPTPTPTVIAAPPGTRDNPHPLGTMLTNGNWEVTLNWVEPDATDQVMSTATYNEPPPEGHVWLLANVTMAYVRPDSSGHPWLDLEVDYFTGGGSVIKEYALLVTAPDELPTAELSTGESATGNMAFAVPADDPDGLLRVRFGRDESPIYVAKVAG